MAICLKVIYPLRKKLILMHWSGVYDLPEGHTISDKDIYLAIPLQKGQISCRELMNGEVLLKPITKDQPIVIDDIDSPYVYSEELKKDIFNRGI